MKYCIFALGKSLNSCLDTIWTFYYLFNSYYLQKNVYATNYNRDVQAVQEEMTFRSLNVFLKNHLYRYKQRDLQGHQES